MRFRHSAALLGAAALILSTACSTVAPKYTFDPNNVNKLKDADLAPVKLGEFSTDNPNVNHVTIRGGVCASPYGTYEEYLKEALKMELDEAKIFNPGAPIEISGLVVRNEINAAGFSTADSFIEAKFVVKRDGKAAFEKAVSIKFEWESSFIGGVAIPRAIQNYPVTVQKLLDKLYSDKDFIQAMKK